MEGGSRGASLYNIYGYYGILKNYVDELDLQEKPDQIWNLDETRFSLDPWKIKLLEKKEFARSRINSGSGRENTSVLLAVNS